MPGLRRARQRPSHLHDCPASAANGVGRSGEGGPCPPTSREAEAVDAHPRSLPARACQRRSTLTFTRSRSGPGGPVPRPPSSAHGTAGFFTRTWLPGGGRDRAARRPTGPGRRRASGSPRRTRAIQAPGSPACARARGPDAPRAPLPGRPAPECAQPWKRAGVYSGAMEVSLRSSVCAGKSR